MTSLHTHSASPRHKVAKRTRWLWISAFTRKPRRFGKKRKLSPASWSRVRAHWRKARKGAR